MAVYSYCRVSTDRQADERAVSLEEQQRQILGRTMEKGWLLTATFIEKGVSGSTPFAKRPEGTRLNTLLKKGDVVIAAKLDRMFRSARDALNVVSDLRARGVSLWLLDLGGDVSGNGLAQVMLTITAAFAEFERDRIGERQREAKRHQKTLGRYLGGTLRFGWRRGAGGIEEDPAEQAVLAEARRLRAQGLSLRAISKMLETTHNITISHAALHRAFSKPQEPQS
jgi:DNA invertase Pin-like site-specific DNA recombinase